MTFGPGLITAILLISAVLAIITWIRTKGSLIKSIGVFLGGALIITFISQPSIMTSAIPRAIKKLIDWAIGLV